MARGPTEEEYKSFSKKTRIFYWIFVGIVAIFILGIAIRPYI